MAIDSKSPEQIVQLQLDAYNAHDIDKFAATYADDAEIYEFPARLLMQGLPQIREHYGSKRFTDASLHAHLEKRIVMDNIVIDHEKVVMALPEGPTLVNAVAIYEVHGGKIAKVTLIRGPKALIN
jgi:hypothetical protein